MNSYRFSTTVMYLAVACSTVRADDSSPMEKAVSAPMGLSIRVRAQGPYDAEVPLQAVCLFKHQATGDKMLGAAATLDEHLDGAISALRNSGQFVGDEMETLMLIPPAGKIKPKALLLIGLGDESKLSLETMQRVGQTALREATRLQVDTVAFAPILRDQGNDTLNIAAVETAVVEGMLLAYDTELRLQKSGLTSPYRLKIWVIEAGLNYFDETVGGVQQGIQQAEKITSGRPAVLLKQAP